MSCTMLRQATTLLATALLIGAAACGGEDGDTKEPPATQPDVAVDAGPTDDAKSEDVPVVVDAGPVADAGPDKCSCKIVQCGIPPGCAQSCGACPAGNKCVNNVCKSPPPKMKLKPLGAFCSAYEGCKPPGSGASQADWNAYYDCLDEQCETQDCSSSVCTTKCNITKDKLINHTGEKGIDGIEDPDSDSDCAGAVDGPHGSKYRCVELRSEAQVNQGQSYQICRAGYTFKPCLANAECPEGEACQLIYLMGIYQTRCRPKHKQPDGQPGKRFSHACNSNPFNGDVALCESGTCFGWGCMEFCKSNDDCVTAPGACKAGKCPNGVACKGDADCSAWRCDPDHKIYSNVEKTFDMCWPKECSVDADCGDPEFYCRLAYNGVQSPDGDPDPDDPDGLIMPGWANYCRRRLPGSVAKGELCDPYSNDDIETHAPCQSPFECDNGVCGAYCDADGDCPASMKCGVSDLRFDPDDPDDGLYDVFLAYGGCVHMPDATTICHAQADCPDGHCKGWSHEVKSGKGDKGGKKAFTADGLCVTPDANKGSFGTSCGALAKEKLCNSGWCANSVSGSGNAQVGFCTDLCSGRAECKPTVDLYGNTYKSICRSYKQTYHQTLPPYDDLYLPYCWVTNSKASLEDCSEKKFCTSTKEACRAYPIAWGPDKPMTVEYWCNWNQNSSGKQPSKKVGAVCDLDSNDYQCLGGYCLTDVAPGAGYCSRICAEDADCGTTTDGMFCDQGNMGFPGLPRSDPKMAAVVPICKKKKSCIPCSWDYQCAGDYRCTNLGGPATLANSRCAPPCEAVKDCALADGGLECKPAVDRNGKALKHKVCTPSCK